MRVYVSIEHRFMKFGDSIYDRTVYEYGFWKPYIDSFGEIYVAARAQGIGSVDESLRRVDLNGVRFIEIPDYRTSPTSLGAIPSLVRHAKKIVEVADALIIRAPCNFGHLLWKYARKAGKPYCVEVVGDIWDVSANEPWILKQLDRQVFTPLVQRECRGADVASYVTKDYLQRRYPPGPHTYESVWSDNRMSRADLITSPRVYTRTKPLKLVYTANFAAYKGHSALIEVVRRVVAGGLDCTLTLIGGGSGREQVESAARAAGIFDIVRFTGQLANSDVIKLLDESDLYVTTSIQEGLPRAIVEAQGRGLPVVGFDVGGIPELVSSDYLTAPGDINGLAHLITRLANSPGELSVASSASLATAAGYVSEVQSVERSRSYEKLIRAIQNSKRGISANPEVRTGLM